VKSAHTSNSASKVVINIMLSDSVPNKLSAQEEEELDSELLDNQDIKDFSFSDNSPADLQKLKQASHSPAKANIFDETSSEEEEQKSEELSEDELETFNRSHSD